jgi:hypothetical protein
VRHGFGVKKRMILVEAVSILLKQKPRTALKMETLCFSEMLVSACKSSWRYNPED